MWSIICWVRSPKMNDNIPIKIIRSKRKSLQVEIHSDCSVIVRAPRWVASSAIARFLEERREWIEETYAKTRKRMEDNPVRDRFSEREIEKLKKEARDTIPALVNEYAAKMGVSFKRICIRCQKNVWGSCSAKGNLNFNCLLMLCPEPVMRYVIVHELCHLKELNHSKRFWAEVEKYCPDYRYLRDFLKDNGEKILLRL